jgi:pilus assembly protein CpaF
MVLMAAANLTVDAIRHQIAAGISLLVHVRRYEDGVRRVESIAEITGMEGSVPLTQELFRFVRRGGSGRQFSGDFEPTGVLPRFIDDLREQGMDVPVEMFHKLGSRRD